VLGARWWSAFTALPGWLRLLAGGGAAGVALVPLLGGVGAGGVQLLLLVAVPPLSLAIAALTGPHVSHAPSAASSDPLGSHAPSAAFTGTRGSHAPFAASAGAGGFSGPTVVLAGLGVVGPLGMVDPGEVTVLLADTVWWVVRGAVLAAGLGLLVGVGCGVVLRWRRTRVRWVVAAAVAAVSVLVAGGAYAAAGRPGWYGDRLLVVLKARADLSGVAALGDRGRRADEVYRRLVATADTSQRGLRTALRGRGLGFTPYYLVNSIEVDSDSPLVRSWLAGRTDVDRVLDSPRLRPLRQTPVAGGGTPLAGQVPWNLAATGADRVASELHVDGHGIVVGSSDSGVDGRHPALRGGFRGGNDSWYDPWYGSRTPVDYQGHGTHTTASAVGAGVGVAPGARWIGCVNLARDTGNPARYLDCWQFMLAPFPRGGDPFTDGDPSRGPQVLTNSWGCAALEGCDAGVLRPAADAFTAAGTFVVVAAGNTGPACGTVTDPPAAYPDVLTVGATGRDGRVAGYSSRGAGKPDLVAPGSDVLSALPGGGYGELTGTSMATPQVAGVVALMWSANPRLVGDLAGTTAILRRTATRVPGGAGCHAAGAGQVDAYAAVRAALELAK
jgi:subtilisin family serine protease